MTKKINYSKPFFLKIEQNIIKNINTDFNRNILKSKLKDIFSNKISKRIKKYNPYHNKNLIEKIYKENIQTKTISILERTLFECLEHFRGSKYYIELEGLEKEYETIINNMKSKETNKYIDYFGKFLFIFEIDYNNTSKIKTKKSNKLIL